MNKLFVIAFLFISSYGKAGDSLLLKLEVTSSYFTTDQLNNIYYINQKNEIVKFEWNTKKIFTFSSKQLGKPEYIDASNPMKVLAFFPGYNSIALLDNTLSPLTTIKFNRTIDGNNYLVAATCSESEDNFIWIFDNLSRKLIKLDERGNKITESEAFNQMFSNQIIPNQLIYNNQILYATDTSNQLLQFDIYGNYVTTLTLPHRGFLQSIQNTFVYLNNGSLEIFDREQYKKTIFTLPQNNLQQINLQGDKLFIRTENSISVYTSPH